MRVITSLPVFAVAILAGSEALALSGQFEGRSDHEMRGTVEIVEQDGGYQVILDEEFFLDGAPDPQLAFGDADGIDDSTIFTVLEANTGRQVYDLPDGIDPTGYESFYVWCVQFNVPLGEAALRE